MICTNNLIKKNWYVLFVLTPYEDSFCSYLNQRYGADAFSVKMENYRKDKKCIEIKSAFPGYVFVRSPLPQDAFNDWLFHLEFKKGLIKQLCYKETTALRAEEIRVFEQFLDKDHLFRMSYGHLQNGRLVIDQGPLKGFEDYITKYDKRNRLAVLDLFFLDQKWTAGVTLIEKDK